MVRHWRRSGEAGWWHRAAVNGFGAVLTAVVLVVVASVKFVDGAWLVVVLIPLLVGMMLFIHRQYTTSRRELAVRADFVAEPPQREERVVIPVPGINRAVIQAVNVGRSIADDVRAVFITDEPTDIAPMQDDWERHLPGVPLVVVESPYRALVGPLSAYLDVLDAAWPPDKESPDHVRGPAGVRRPTVVGADPLQPVGEAAAELAPRPAPHGRRQRPVPARGPGVVREARRAAADPDRRPPGETHGSRWYRSGRAAKLILPRSPGRYSR